MTEIVHIDQNARRSRAVVHNGLVYTAGQVPDDMSQDVTGQTRQVLAKIDDLLKQAGTDKSRVLTAQIWLRTIEDLAAISCLSVSGFQRLFRRHTRLIGAHAVGPRLDAARGR